MVIRGVRRCSMLVVYLVPRLNTSDGPGMAVAVGELGPSPAVGDGDDQDDQEPGPLASSTSDATVRDATRSMPAFRSAVSVLVSFVVRSFSTNSRPALRAAACGGRPRPAAPTDAA
jgi:hypothetical protein